MFTDNEITIFFRGNNTDNIIDDAQESGIVSGKTIIICMDNDRLRKDGDIEISNFNVEPGVYTIICNGGGTYPLARLMIILSQVVDRPIIAKLYDVQHDGYRFIGEIYSAYTFLN